ncbi:MAG: FecR family protein [Paracoccaceae bacterium]
MTIKAHVAATVIAAATFASPLAAQERAGRATAVQPDAFQAAGIAGLPVGKNDAILRQARVYTKQHGTIDIRLEDGTNLTVAPNASLVIDDYVFAGPQRAGTLALSLSRGAVRMVSGRMPKDGVAITTPVATIGVRGTDFWVNAANADLIELWVTEGVVTAAPTQSDAVFEFPAPAYATCSVSGCQTGDAPPVPVTNPLGGAGGGGGDPGIDVDYDRGDDHDDGLSDNG